MQVPNVAFHNYIINLTLCKNNMFAHINYVATYRHIVQNYITYIVESILKLFYSTCLLPYWLTFKTLPIHRLVTVRLAME